MKKVAIIGSGISGLAAAYLLNNHYDIRVYEQNRYIGGHSRTVTVHTDDGEIPVDTGFIVYNRENYPNLTALFERLEVPALKSNMSFGVSINNGWLEYGSQTLNNVFAQRRNLLNPGFLRLLSHILRFNAASRRAINQGQLNREISLQEYLAQHRLGEWFTNYYLLAMGAAIWSTPLKEMHHFPAHTFVRFFYNHGLLYTGGQPQWYSVEGGSQAYVKRLIHSFKDKIRPGCGVKAIRRFDHQVEIRDDQGGRERFDHVIMATHSDQALGMLEQPTATEQSLLGRIRWQKNDMVLHSDPSFMPRSRRAWSSWVYLSEKGKDNGQAISLSYWMNNLQKLPTTTPVIVTLNPGREPAHVHDRYQFAHPLFDADALEAQQQLKAMQGQHHTWYTGAWMGHGFHEDGINSAIEVARALGVTPPWQVA